MMSRLLTRREQFILGFLAVALMVGSITVFALRSTATTPAPIVVTPADPVPRSSRPESIAVKTEPASVSEEVVVSVQGRVAKPGVYTVDANSRVHELIEMAGGLAPFADTSGLNLAARVVDGTTLTVPSREDDSADAAATSALQNPDAYTVSSRLGGATASVSGAAGLIDLNRATQAQLETLPGIGPKLAQQIIQYRDAQPFGTVADLENVSGIGPARLDAVRDLVTVR